MFWNPLILIDLKGQFLYVFDVWKNSLSFGYSQGLTEVEPCRFQVQDHGRPGDAKSQVEGQVFTQAAHGEAILKFIASKFSFR